MRILITGASGQLGRELQYWANETSVYSGVLSFVFADRSVLDIAQLESIPAFFEQQQFDFCINCAAYTAVDKAEKEPEQAHLVNVLAVEALAMACAQKNIPLVHISTDYVYHNHENTPLHETDRKNPRSIYGKTKLEGEQRALSAWAKTLIVRTSWVYSAFGTNFVKTMLNLSQRNSEVRVIADQIGSPTYARDLAGALLEIVLDIKSNPHFQQYGVYQYSNEGVCSWYDFAHAIFELSQSKTHLSPIRTLDYPTPATRPAYSVMEKTRTKSTFGLKIPHWRDSLKACLKVLGY